MHFAFFIYLFFLKKIDDPLQCYSGENMSIQTEEPTTANDFIRSLRIWHLVLCILLFISSWLESLYLQYHLNVLLNAISILVHQILILRVWLALYDISDLS